MIRILGKKIGQSPFSLAGAKKTELSPVYILFGAKNPAQYFQTRSTLIHIRQILFQARLIRFAIKKKAVANLHKAFIRQGMQV
jgi:hypothetical protein